MARDKKTHGFIINFKDWGPAYWKVAHTVTFLYPTKSPSQQDKDKVRAFFVVFPAMLPCSICTGHFIATLEDIHPLTDEVLSSRDTLSRWLVDVHNSVNARTGKPKVDYETVKTFYLKDSSVLNEKPKNIYKRATIILSILLVLVLATCAYLGISMMS